MKPALPSLYGIPDDGEPLTSREWMGQPRDEALSFAGILDALYAQRYTGPITLHLKDGKPAVVELPSPKIRLR